MSKGRGKKIAIKFDKALLGDVAGNQGAFTISGLEKSPLFYGEPALRQYAVEKVERYPLAELWRDDFAGALDGVEVGENGVALEKGSAPVGYSGDKIPAMTSHTAPAGTASASTEFSGTWAAWHAMDDGPATYWSNTSGSLPAWLQYEFAAAVIIAKYSVRARSDASDGTPKTWELQAWDGTKWAALDSRASEAGWANGERREYTCNNATAYTKYRLYIAANNGRGTVNVAEFELMEPLFEFTSPGTYTTTTPADTLPENPRLKWTEDLPTGTSITAEYAVNQDALTPPAVWTAVSNAGLLTIPDPATGYFLWLKYTLATTDTTVTPTLLAVWLEEAEAPPDTILLTMAETGRFNDTEGDLTVAYDQALGNLKGTRPVASFEESFTPTDLEPTPVHEHTITVRGEPVVHLLPYDAPPDPDYEVAQSPPHTISATAGVISIDFIHVDDIVT